MERLPDDDDDVPEVVPVLMDLISVVMSDMMDFPMMMGSFIMPKKATIMTGM